MSAPNDHNPQRSTGHAPTREPEATPEPVTITAPSEPEIGAASTSLADQTTVAYQPSSSTNPSETPLPSFVGYEIEGVLGRGGMGIVYEARQTKLGRIVALKMILSGAHAGEDALARFRTEGEAIARLQHPNIVQIYEVGEQDGLPFFSLEFCAGGSLAKKLNGTPFPPREAAALVEILARAMHSAHEKGVIHRDLKPANVLLAEDGTPKITDFGLAKKIDEAGHTISGMVMGTPSYMAPEQAGGKSKEMGPATDTYALGAILYECLTGRPPFRAQTPLDTLLQVLETEPAAPRAINPSVPRDLDTICLKCLHKEPTKRYGSAAALADDLQRWLGGEPILARPAGAPERLAKWARRRPALAATLAAALLAFVGLSVFGALWSRARAEATDFELQAARARGDEEQHVAEVERDKQDALAKALKREEGERERAQNEWKRAEENKRDLAASNQQQLRTLYNLQLSLVGAILERDPTFAAELLADTERCPPDRREFTWGLFYRTTRRERGGPLRGGFGVAFSPDGKLLATGSDDKLVRLYDVSTGKELKALPGHDGAVRRVAFSPNGKLLASGADDRKVVLWDVAAGKETKTFKVNGGIETLAFSPDGKLLVAGGGQFENEEGKAIDKRVGFLQCWEVEGGKPYQRFTGHTDWPSCAVFSPNGKFVLSSGYDGTARLWNVETGKEEQNWKGRIPLLPFLAVAFARDGRMAIGGALGAQTMGPGEGQQSVLVGHRGWVFSAAFSPDGGTLATGGEDSTVRLWDMNTGKELATLKGHSGMVFSVAFSPDGTTLASAAADVRLWRAGRGSERATFETGGKGVNAIALSGDEKLVAATGGEHVTVWESATGKRLAQKPVQDSFLYGIGYAPDDESLAFCGYNVGLQGLHAKTLLPRENPAVGALYSALAVAPDRKAFITGDTGGMVTLWDAVTRKTRRTLKATADGKAHAGAVQAVAYSRDGKQVASGGNDAIVRLWDVETGQEIRTFKGHSDAVSCIAFAPDGKTVATGMGVVQLAIENKDDPREVWLWDVESGQTRAKLKGHRGKVLSVAFSPDGKTLASGSTDGTIHLWDPLSGQYRAAIPAHRSWVTSLVFSADGERLYSGSSDGTVKVWEAEFPKTVP